MNGGQSLRGNRCSPGGGRRGQPRPRGSSPGACVKAKRKSAAIAVITTTPTVMCRTTITVFLRRSASLRVVKALACYSARGVDLNP